MAVPTSISVSTDSIEYSRYEVARDTINVAVSAVGGAPYAGEILYVDLVKARRARDAVVATRTLTLDGTDDPQELTTSFYLPDLVDSDLISLIRHGKYFIRTLSPALPAEGVIGAGANGSVEITATAAGVDGNNLTVNVVNGVGTSPLTISVIGDAVTIVLATSLGVPVPSSNTAQLVAARLNANNTVVRGLATGTGGTPLVAAAAVALTGGVEEVSAESEDFNLRIVSVARFKTDFLFGIPLTATSIKMPKTQPILLTGVSVVEVDASHGSGFGALSYSYLRDPTANATLDIGAGADGTVTGSGIEDLAGSAGNGVAVIVEVPAGTSGLSVASTATSVTISLAVSGGAPVGGSNTATLIAAAIELETNFSAEASGTGADSIATASAGILTGGTTTTIRTLSWKGGPVVSVTRAGQLVLRAGASGPFCKVDGSSEYIVVQVAGLASLPTTSVVEEILITEMKMDDETLGRYLSETITWIERVFLQNVFLEPTNVVTDVDPTTIQFSAGIANSLPIYTDTDYDFLVTPLTYYIPTNNSWVQVQTPYPKMLRVDSLFGAIANTRIIDIDLEWVEHSEHGGLLQLVPYNQETAFDFLGLIGVNAIRGAISLPNFWHYNIIAGVRDATPELQLLIGKMAAIEALTALAAAFRPGLGSVSLSRDGVSQSVSYTAQQTYGIYTGAIQANKDWFEATKATYLAKYRGLKVLMC